MQKYETIPITSTGVRNLLRRLCDSEVCYRDEFELPAILTVDIMRVTSNELERVDLITLLRKVDEPGHKTLLARLLAWRNQIDCKTSFSETLRDFQSKRIEEVGKKKAMEGPVTEKMLQFAAMFDRTLDSLYNPVMEMRFSLEVVDELMGKSLKLGGKRIERLQDILLRHVLADVTDLDCDLEVVVEKFKRRREDLLQ